MLYDSIRTINRYFVEMLVFGIVAEVNNTARSHKDKCRDENK
jgi:hypothetical protein